METKTTTYGGIQRLEDCGDMILDTQTGKVRSKEEVEEVFYDAYIQDAVGDEYSPIDYDAGYRAYLKEFEEDLIEFINGKW